MITGILFAFVYGFFSLHVNCFPFSIWIWVLRILTTECSLLFIFGDFSSFCLNHTWVLWLTWLSGTGFSCIFTAQLNPTSFAIRRHFAKPVTQRRITTFRLTHTPTIAITVSITITIAVTIFLGFGFWFSSSTECPFSFTEHTSTTHYLESLGNRFAFFICVAVIISCFTFAVFGHSIE